MCLECKRQSPFCVKWALCLLVGPLAIESRYVYFCFRFCNARKIFPVESVRLLKWMPRASLMALANDGAVRTFTCGQKSAPTSADPDHSYYDNDYHNSDGNPYQLR